MEGVGGKEKKMCIKVSLNYQQIKKTFLRAISSRLLLLYFLFLFLHLISANADLAINE